MQEVKLYDPTRTPTNWLDIIQPHQYALFHVDVKSWGDCTPEGKPIMFSADSSCLIFDSLAEAEAYAAQKIAELPTVSCEIYDHEGKAKNPTKVFIHDTKRSFYTGTSTYQSDLFWGSFWIFVGVGGFFFISWWENWTYIFSCVVSSKPLVVGSVRFFGGISKWERHRNRVISESTNS